MEEKIIQFANFNITFGRNNAPMLEYFEEIIYPALTSGYVRGKKDEYPRFSFADVAVKEHDNEYVLVGNYIKETEYEINTTVEDGDLVSSPAHVPTAPYSRFIIFLKNHKMVLVRNEIRSPDIRSFQKMVRTILNDYISNANRQREQEELLPIPIVHIVDIPLRENIDEVLKNVSKVKWLKFRFFPLNNDLDPMPLMREMRSGMQSVGSRTGNVIFNSPGSKNGIKNVIDSTAGLAVPSMQVTDSEGQKRNIKEGSFSSSAKIEYVGNVNSQGDPYIISKAKTNQVIAQTSPDNANLYERMKERLKRFLR